MEKASAMRIAMVLFPRLTQLDLTGPFEVMARMPESEVALLSHDLIPVVSDRGLALTPTTTFDDCRETDILFVPGGPGQLEAMGDTDLLAAVRRLGEGAQWITSVCTGSLVLGAAGLLRGKRATTHWTALDLLALLGAEPVAERVVVDGNVVTGAGVSAGIDFALRLAALVHGEEAARRIQLQIEYDPAPHLDCGAPDKASPETLAHLRQAASELTAKRREVARAIGRERLGLDV